MRLCRNRTCSFFCFLVVCVYVVSLQVVRGTKIPADGEVVFGSAFVDEAMITGLQSWGHLGCLARCALIHLLAFSCIIGACTRVS
jgi:hypothetical protein